MSGGGTDLENHVKVFYLQIIYFCLLQSCGRMHLAFVRLWQWEEFYAGGQNPVLCRWSRQEV